jgi:hypothetical protein
MDITLARKLIAKGAIRQKTEIDAKFRGVGIDGKRSALTQGTFFIKGARMTVDNLIFEAVNTQDGDTIRIDVNDIYKVDGMEPSRFAQINGLDGDGEPVKPGKRRGRRTNAEKAAMAAAAEGLSDDDDDDDFEDDA